MKKTIALFLIVFVLLSVIAVPAYAVVLPPDLPDNIYDYWVVISIGNNEYSLVSSVEPITYDRERDILFSDGRYIRYELEGNQWVQVGSGSQLWRSFERIFSSNHDITYKDEGSVFFFTPTGLSQAARKTDLKVILTAILGGLTPILGCLILGICLRLAWAFLRSQLRS